MLDQYKHPSPPNDDKRWKIVTAAMRRYGHKPHSLIETMHTVQETFGYLDDVSIRFIATSLHVPLSRVYGVATFYHYFQLKPPGEHTCVICTGTACYIKGVPRILDAVKEEFQIEPGQTTPDQKISLISARCVGACGLAPVAVFDGEVVGNLTHESCIKRMLRWKNNES